MICISCVYNGTQLFSVNAIALRIELNLNVQHIQMLFEHKDNNLKMKWKVDVFQYSGFSVLASGSEFKTSFSVS